MATCEKCYLPGTHVWDSKSQVFTEAWSLRHFLPSTHKVPDPQKKTNLCLQMVSAQRATLTIQGVSCLSVGFCLPTMFSGRRLGPHLQAGLSKVAQSIAICVPSSLHGPTGLWLTTQSPSLHNVCRASGRHLLSFSSHIWKIYFPFFIKAWSKNSFGYFVRCMNELFSQPNTMVLRKAK